MSSWRDIKYYGFWDQPRTFHTLGGEQTFLFDCQFDESLDDYPSTYNVYEIPRSDLASLQMLLNELSTRSSYFLGTLALPQSAFDETLRRQIDLGILSELTPPDDHGRA
jgi:hypothetical protein